MDSRIKISEYVYPVFSGESCKISMDEPKVSAEDSFVVMRAQNDAFMPYDFADVEQRISDLEGDDLADAIEDINRDIEDSQINCAKEIVKRCIGEGVPSEKELKSMRDINGNRVVEKVVFNRGKKKGGVRV